MASKRWLDHHHKQRGVYKVAPTTFCLSGRMVLSATTWALLLAIPCTGDWLHVTAPLFSILLFLDLVASRWAERRWLVAILGPASSGGLLLSPSSDALSKDATSGRTSDRIQLSKESSKTQSLFRPASSYGLLPALQCTFFLWTVFVFRSPSPSFQQASLANAIAGLLQCIAAADLSICTKHSRQPQSSPPAPAADAWPFFLRTALEAAVAFIVVPWACDTALSLQSLLHCLLCLLFFATLFFPSLLANFKGSFTFAELVIVCHLLALLATDALVMSVNSLRLLAYPGQPAILAATLYGSVESRSLLCGAVLGPIAVHFLYARCCRRKPQTQPAAPDAAATAEALWYSASAAAGILLVGLWVSAVCRQPLPLIIARTLGLLDRQLTAAVLRLVALLLFVVGTTAVHLQLIQSWIQPNYPLIVARKGFHLLAVSVFVPILLFCDPSVMPFLFCCGLSLFLLFESMSKWILPKGVRRWMVSYTDDRDQQHGQIILTHVYLLVGCALPGFLYGWNRTDASVLSHFPAFSSSASTAVGSDGSGNLHRWMVPYLGILSVGIGDSMACLCGLLPLRMSPGGGHGHTDGNKSAKSTLVSSRRRHALFWNSTKSWEGFCGCFVSVLLSFTVLLLFLAGPGRSLPVLRRLGQGAVFSLSVALVESSCDHVDNLVLPIFSLMTMLCLA